jgi:hypothetical protein
MRLIPSIVLAASTVAHHGARPKIHDRGAWYYQKLSAAFCERHSIGIAVWRVSAFAVRSLGCPTLDNGFNDIRRQEGKADQAAHVPYGYALTRRDAGKRPRFP